MQTMQTEFLTSFQYVKTVHSIYWYFESGGDSLLPAPKMTTIKIFAPQVSSWLGAPPDSFSWSKSHSDPG